MPCLISKNCDFCGNKFEDGDILSIYSSNEVYHTFRENFNLKKDSCFYKHFPEHEEHREIFSGVIIHYSSKFYHPYYFDNEGELQTFFDMDMKPNKRGNGDRITGNLEELLKTRAIVLD